MINMKTLFDLPSKYANNKKLTKDYFLKRANLTLLELDELKRYLIEIDVVYDIEYPDSSELLLIDVQIKRKNTWTFSKIAAIITKSIPYHSLIYIRDADQGRLYLSQTRNNTRNSYRKVVKGTREGWVFYSDKDNQETFLLVEDLKKILLSQSGNVEMVIQKCIARMQDYKNMQRNSYFELNSYKPTTRDLIDERMWNLIAEGINNGFTPYTFEMFAGNKKDDFRIEEEYHNDGHEWYYNELEWYDYKTQSSFMNSLSDSAYAFYLDYASEIPEKDWLLQYSKICNHIFEYIFHEELPEHFYHELGAKFNNHEIIRHDDYYIDFVKEYLEDKTDAFIAEIQ